MGGRVKTIRRSKPIFEGAGSDRNVRASPGSAKENQPMKRGLAIRSPQDRGRRRRRGGKAVRKRRLSRQGDWGNFSFPAVLALGGLGQNLRSSLGTFAQARQNSPTVSSAAAINFNVSRVRSRSFVSRAFLTLSEFQMQGAQKLRSETHLPGARQRRS